MLLITPLQRRAGRLIYRQGYRDLHATLSDMHARRPNSDPSGRDMKPSSPRPHANPPGTGTRPKSAFIPIMSFCFSFLFSNRPALLRLFCRTYIHTYITFIYYFHNISLFLFVYTSYRMAALPPTRNFLIPMYQQWAHSILPSSY